MDFAWALYQLNSCMLRMKPDRQILKNIRKYTQKEGRVSFQLRQLTELLRFSPLSLYSSRLLDAHHGLSSAFKLFLLFHRLIIQNPSECSVIYELLGKLVYSISGSLQQMLEQKLIKPYRMYLQRRILLHLDGQTEPKSEDKEAKVYQLLNIINLATSFGDVIYTFGRYYLGKFGCAIDFNIALGVDLNGLYDQMVRSVKRPAKRAILDEIQAAHQKMYVVFYNCYFHKYLKSYIPKWVNTDVYALQMRRKAQTPQKDSTKSTVSRQGTGSRSFSSLKGKKLLAKEKSYGSNLADSCLFLNQKVQEEVEEDPQFWECNFNQGSKVGKVQRSTAKVEQETKEINDEQNRERLKLLLSMQRVVGKLQNS